MLRSKAWLIVGVPVHPKAVGWGRGQGLVQAGQVLPHRIIGKTIFENGAGVVHGNTVMSKLERGLPQAVATKLEKTTLSKASFYAVA